jgi:hypothetical protein
MARLQGERPVAIFYPFGHPTPYASGLNKQIPRGAGFCESSAKLCIKSRGATHVKWKVFCLHALSQLGREQSTSISLPTNHNQSQPVTMQPIRTDSPSLEKKPFEFVSHFIATMGKKLGLETKNEKASTFSNRVS